MHVLVFPFFAAPRSATAKAFYLSLRSFEQHFQEDFRLVVVGNAPPEHLKPERVTFIPSLIETENLGVQEFYLLKKVARLFPQFYWIQEYSFLLHDTVALDLQRLYFDADLAGLEHNKEKLKSSSKAKLATYLQNKKLGLSNYDFTTQNPYFVMSNILMDELYAYYDFDSGKYLWENAYFNYICSKFALKPSTNNKSIKFTSSTDFSDTKLAQMHFLSCTSDSFANQLEDYLTNRFACACKFEISLS